MAARPLRKTVLAIAATGAILALLGSSVALGAPHLAAAIHRVVTRVAAGGTSHPPTPAEPGPATDWTSYGGGLGNTFANPTSPLSAATAPTLHMAWFAPAPGEVSSNPIASGNQVFFGTYDGSVQAVARDTGNLLWRDTLDGSPIDGGMLLDGGTLFAATSGGEVVAMDPATGQVKWTSANLLGGLKDALRASPVAYGGVIYESLGGTDDDLTEQGGVVALDEQTGRVLWRTMLVNYDGGGAAVFSPPAVIPQLGELVVATGNPTPFPGNAAADGAVPAGSDPESDSLVALSLQGGQILWSAQALAHDGNDDDFIGAPNVVTLAGGTVAVGDGSKSGAYYLMNAATGRDLWHADLNLPGQQTLIVATAAAADGRIFVGTMDVDPNGQWPANYQAPGTGRLVALDQQTGKVLWSEALPGSLAAAPVVGNGVVMALAADGQLLAVDAATGARLSQQQAPGEVWNAEAALSLAGGTLLVPLADPGGVADYTLDAAGPS
ncbi:MAG TPA: PQQ-binding-like beta-propeller repeat protein [Bacillota bacterium]|nr:PQQ-binding-like beta-propeller repeat protein [Bacillota bacterium]